MRSLVRAAVGTVQVRFMLRVRGFERTVRWVRSTPPSGARRSRPISGLRTVRWAGRWLPGRDTCLVRSLVLARMLSADGHPAVVFIGMRPVEGGTPEAHAWVGIERRVVSEAPADGFRTIYEIALGAGSAGP